MKKKVKKNVLITGAGSGLGKEAAILLARRGHFVMAAVYYENQIEDLRKTAEEENLKMEVFQLDILIPEERKKILSYPIDVFIANAAIGDSGSVADIAISRIRNVFETNIFANLELVQLVIEHMLKQNTKGRIVFLTSLAGRIPYAFLAPYCASKFALEAFATCLRKELKLLKNCDIQVGVIEPGAYATGFNKENNEKKYAWMKTNSYFKDQVDEIFAKELLFWNFIEQKPYTSILKQYIRVVEDPHLKHRYYAPWWQALFTQLGRIFGM